MEWNDIALPVGSPEQRYFGMHLNLTLPAAIGDLPATPHQAEAVRLFYQVDPDDLHANQAHALLSCREYARLCSEAIFKRFPVEVRSVLARAIAAFLLTDERMTKFVINWNDRNFERGTSSPRVRGTPYFADVEAFASYLDGMLEMNGWTVAHMKQLAW